MRQRLITIRVDDGEHATFRGAAVAAGVSLSVFARDAMMARIALERTVAQPAVVVVESTPAPVVARRVVDDPLGPVRGEAKPCRHGLPNCRVCQTGVYA